MALNIKDPAADRLARELAAATGESITVAARVAIEERLARIRHQRRARGPADELDEILKRGRDRRLLDHRTEDEILGYGPDGLPQ
jgi:antitoxin VapB